MEDQPKIYLFGNELLERDSLPLRIKPFLEERLSHLSFEVHDPTDNLWPNNGTLTIIDTAEVIDRVIHIDKLEKIQIEEKPCSVHDMDLSFHLKLLWKLGVLEQVDIIAVPLNYKEEKAVEEIIEVLLKLYPINP